MSPTARRPVLITSALLASLALTACGGQQDSPQPSDAGSAASSASSAEATPSPSPSEPTTPSASPSTGSSDAPSAPAQEPARTQEPSAGAPAPDPASASAPEADRPPQPEAAAQAPSEQPVPAAPEAPQAPQAPAPSAAETPLVQPGPVTGVTPPTEQQDPALAAACAPGALSASLTPVDAAMGTAYYTLSLTNSGGEPCTLQGPPSVSYVDAAHRGLGAPAAVQGASGSVSLAPGESVSAELAEAGPDAFAGRCAPQQAAGLLIFVPGGGQALEIPHTAQACSNPEVTQLSVRALGA